MSSSVRASTSAAGYAHARYAEALAEFGHPRELVRSAGWLLERPTPASATRDAMGSYPLFACVDWSGLREDLQEIGRSLVSVVLVADPFGNWDASLLERTFNQGAIPFKEHLIVNFRTPLEQAVSSHHRRNVRKAARVVQAELVADPPSSLDDWVTLYQTLVLRHGIEGIRAFSRGSFARQLSTPGMVAFRAIHEGETVGMLLFYVQKDVAYYHLGAYSERGYETGAAFVLFWTALQHFKQSVEQVSLGGDAGVGGEAGGLARFKRGWASETRPAFLCRHIGDADTYAELARAHPATAFFPAYRQGEFSDRARVAADDSGV